MKTVLMFLLSLMFLVSCSSEKKLIDDEMGYIFVPHFSSDQVSVIQVNSDFTLKNKIEPISLHRGHQPSQVLYDQEKKMLYLSNWGSASITVYFFDQPKNQLQFLQEYKFYNAVKPHAMAFDSSKTKMLIAHESSPGYVTVLSVDSTTGLLSGSSQSEIRLGDLNTWVEASVDHTRFFVTSRGNHLIYQLQISGHEVRVLNTIREKTGQPYMALPSENTNKLFVNHYEASKIFTYDVSKKIKKREEVLLLKDYEPRSMCLDEKNSRLFVVSSKLGKVTQLNIKDDGVFYDREVSILNPRHVVCVPEQKMIIVFSDEGVTIYDNSLIKTSNIKVGKLPLFGAFTRSPF